MTRVALIGNAGGGKSTLARALAARQDLPLHHVDPLQSNPDGSPLPDPVVAERLDALAGAPRWIIDGWGPWPSIERRFGLADTIIWIDHPLETHLAWAARRRDALAGGGAPPPDVHPLAGTERVFDAIRAIDRLKPRLAALVERFAGGRDVHHLTSPQALDRFAAAHT